MAPPILRSVSLKPPSPSALAERCLAAIRAALRRALARTGWGIRGKLIAIFIAIKIAPLVLLAWFAWMQSERLGELLAVDANRLTVTADRSVTEVGHMAIADSMQALNDRMREEIERQTTDAARRIATFLGERDHDIRHARLLEPDEKAYRSFLAGRLGGITTHGRWELAADGKTWQALGEKDVAAPTVAKVDPEVKTRMESV